MDGGRGGNIDPAPAIMQGLRGAETSFTCIFHSVDCEDRSIAAEERMEPRFTRN
jgi:hypothetical protein